MSDIPGTTRDYLEATFEFKGYRLNLFDSAGFRHSDDQIEQLGIERISSLLDRAHVICWCVDQSDQFNADDNSVYEAIKSHHNVLVFKTKSDLDSKLILNEHITFPSYPISVYNKDLTTQIKSIFYEHTVHVSESVNLDLLCNIRQKACLDQLEQWFLHFLNDLESRYQQQERRYTRQENIYRRQIEQLQGQETVAIIPTAPDMANEVYPLSPPSSPIRRSSVIATRIEE